MDEIVIKDLKVHYRVGVSDPERANPQPLSLTVRMRHNLARAAQTDALENTIDYHALARRLLGFGHQRQWRLLETLAVELAQMILSEFKPEQVSVEVKKFILPEARYVSVRVTRPLPLDGHHNPETL